LAFARILAEKFLNIFLSKVKISLKRNQHDRLYLERKYFHQYAGERYAFVFLFLSFLFLLSYTCKVVGILRNSLFDCISHVFYSHAIIYVNVMVVVIICAFHLISCSSMT
jgi:hypothetical protein